VAEQNQKYLDYLDKEMTIMGILSTFTVAIVALFLQQIGSAEEAKRTLLYFLWQEERWYIILGSVSILLAATLFYLQRADLAWHYGRLARAADETNNPTNGVEFLKEADSWATWIPYVWGFKFLWIGLNLYLWAFATIDTSIPQQWWWMPFVVVIILLLIGAFQTWLQLAFS
jgi:hypothetical protein